MNKFSFRKRLTALVLLSGVGVIGIIFSFSQIPQGVLFSSPAALAQTSGNPPPPAGWPAGTASARTNVTYNYASFLAPDPDGDQVKLILDWGDGTAWESPFYALVPGSGSQTIFAAHAWSAPGTYTVRAKEKDATGLESANWSTSISVTVANNANHLPSVPATPTGPSNVNTQTSYQYSTFLYPDIDGDQVQAVFDWGDGSAVTATSLITPQPGGTLVSASHTWTAATPAGVFGYYVKVQARENFGAGLETAWSTPLSVSAAVPPATPAGLAAAAVSVSLINLSWDASASNIGYKIYRNGSFLTNTTANAYSDSGLSAGTSYSYTVAGYNTAGNVSAPTSPVSATTPSVSNVPAAPGLSGYQYGGTGLSVNFTWSDNSSNETGFTLYTRPAGETSWRRATQADFSANSTQMGITDYNLTAGTHEYKLNACNSSGCSADSNIVLITFTASVFAATPSNLTAAGSGANVNLSWSDNAANETEYRVYQLASDGSILAQVGFGLAANATSWIHSGVAAGTYKYRVNACTATGCSLSSNQPIVTVVPVSGGPNPPASVTASSVVGKNSVTWPSSGAAKYTIWRSLSGGIYQLWYTNIASTSYQDLSVSQGIGYRYKVYGCNSDGTTCSANGTESNSITYSGGVVSCTSLTLTLNDGKTTYTIGTDPYVNYTWTCSPGGSASNVYMWLRKPDDTSLLLNSSSGGSTQTFGLGINNNFLPGGYVLKACFDSNCAIPIASQTYTLVSAAGSGTTTTAATTTTITTTSGTGTAATSATTPTAAATPVVIPTAEATPATSAVAVVATSTIPTSTVPVTPSAVPPSPAVVPNQPPAVVVAPSSEIQFFSTRREILRDLRAVERSVKRGEAELDQKQLRTIKAKLLTLPPGTADSAAALQVYREQITDLRQEAGEGETATLAPRVAARALRQLKQDSRIFERYLAIINTKISQLEKSGLTVDDAIKDTVAAARDIIKQVKAAATYDDIQEIAAEVPEVGQALNDALPRLQSLLNLQRALRLVELRIQQAERAISQSATLAKRLKLDAGEQLEEMRLLLANAKSSLTAIKAEGVTEDLNTLLTETVLKPTNDILTLAGQLQAVGSARAVITRAAAEVKFYAVRMRRLKQAKEEVSAAEDLLAQFQEQLAGLRTAAGQKLTAEVGDQMVEYLRTMSFLRDELESVLRLPSVDPLLAQIKRLFTSPEEKLTPFKVEQLERGVL